MVAYEDVIVTKLCITFVCRVSEFCRGPRVPQDCLVELHFRKRFKRNVPAMLINHGLCQTIFKRLLYPKTLENEPSPPH